MAREICIAVRRLPFSCHSKRSYLVHNFTTGYERCTRLTRTLEVHAEAMGMLPAFQLLVLHVLLL